MKRLFPNLVVTLLLSLFLPRSSQADGSSGPGTNNPTGVTGDYNGSVTTAGSYDPFTGNAKREVHDLTVTGSVGAYPLEFTRILNTRAGTGILGSGGGWKHNYQWALRISHPPPAPPGGWSGCYTPPPDATISYPDGAKRNLRQLEDGTYEQLDGWEPMGDRLVDIGGDNYDLHLKDGGLVEFRTGPHGHPATAIVDPYGQRTILYYDPNTGLLSTITEPAHRFLKLSYTTFHYRALTNPTHEVYVDFVTTVEAWDGLGHLIEKVLYHYDPCAALPPFGVTYWNLTTATYDDGNTAVYEYSLPIEALPGNQLSKVAGKVEKCHDVRCDVAMKNIMYEYVPITNSGCLNVVGQILSEKNVNGQTLSTVEYPYTGFCLQGPSQRTERRPDGATRLINYNDGELVNYTDFAYPSDPQHTTGISYVEPAPGNNDHYLRTVTDARNYPTSTEKEYILGAVMAVIHPNGSRMKYTYSDPADPHYLASSTDERDKTTYYDRYCVGSNPCDPANRNRVWQIRYPDGGLEIFTYNNFGQVLTHQLTSGGTEVFTYDTRGLKQTYVPPSTLSDDDPGSHPTLYYYYENGPHTDRLRYTVDPRLNATWYEYNQRGLVTKVTHQDGFFTQSQYNGDGTLDWAADENHPGAETDMSQRTRYEYDEYKRVTKVTNPLGKATNTSYAPWNGFGPLSHTSSSIYSVTSQMGKVTESDYDANFRRTRMTVAPNTNDSATTTYTYDEVGNLKTVKDPKGQSSGRVTTYEYDDRNRRQSVTDADTPGKPTQWLYDDAGNMTSETRADTKVRTWDLYDAMNRVKHTTGFLGAIEQTSYDYNTSGNLTRIIDPNQRVYQIGYDELNRKKSFTYPSDTLGYYQYEIWRYDIAGNLLWSKNPADQYKHFGYDNRNRLTRSYWNTSFTDTTANWNIGPETNITPDPASRVTEIKTNNGETIVAYGYDDANHKIWEDQTVSGFTRRVATVPDADGNRGAVAVSNVPGSYSFGYDYTPRQQLKQINRAGSSYVEFSYDPNGNLTRRQNMAQGQGSDATRLQYDDLNRVTICEHTGHYDEMFARSDYNDYDLVNNLKSISRQEDGDKGETFSYDYANQLSSVSYKADVTWHRPTGAPGGGVDTVEKDDEKETLAALAADPDREPLAKAGGEIEAVSGPRTVTYENDALNRLSMNDPNNGMATVFAANHLNQYTSVTDHGTLNYDGNLNVSGYDGWTFGHDAEKRLLSVTGNGHSALFAYDGLGRCVKRIIDGATTVFTYDGWKPVAEWTSGGTFVAWNLYGAGADEILVRYQQNPAGYLHYHLDAMGNVQFLLSDQPNPGLEKYTYDVFGKPTITGWNGDGRPVSNHGNRFLFTGREYLYSFGLYDYRHRIYHPGLGRFIETDPLGQQIEGAKLSAEQTALYGDGAPEKFSSSELNLYRYCHNDPVDKSDPLGLDGDVYVYRNEGRGSLNNNVSLYENGHYLGSFTANPNPYVDGTRGPREGTYALLPKATMEPGDRFPVGTPSVTALQYADPRSSDYAPGRAGPDYKKTGTVRVHEQGRVPGVPDSEACLTGPRSGVEAVKNLMDRNTDHGGTKIHYIDRQKDRNGNPTPRANRVREKRFQ